MKNVFSHLPKKLLFAFATLLVLAGLSAGAVASFGPDRPTMAWSTASNGADHVVFNSFTGVPNGIGDERDFMRGVQVGRDSVWSDPVTGVTQDAEVEAKVYIHNNANPTLNDAAGNPGVAKNVTVKVAVPTGSKQSQVVNASIKADNANPGTITDTLDITGANNGYFELNYVPGTAVLHKGGTNTTLTAAQEQALMTTGFNTGDQKGCFDFVQEITFRMKVKMPNYSLQKAVRFEGQTAADWKEVVNAQPGQTVEWKLAFVNTGTTSLKQVKLVDNIPAHITVVPGSVKLVNSQFPNGFVYGPEAIQANGKQINVNINDYAPNGNAALVFKTVVDSVDKLDCGVNKIQNRGYATPEGYGAISDTADVTVSGKVCNETKPKTPVYSCDSLKAIIVDKNKRTVKFEAHATAENGAKVKQFSVDAGYAADTTDVVKFTDTTSPEVTYPKDKNEFVAVLSVDFTVDNQGTVKSVSNDKCRVTVKFDATTTTTTTTTTTLPNTGAGSVLGIFVATVVAGAVAFRLFAQRKLNR